MGTPTDLGKVSIVPKGNYSASAQYERLDVVTDNGSAYISIRNGTGHSVSDTTYWYKLVGAGDGISSITGPVSVDNVDTYTINYGSGNTKTFTVTNGSSISGISKTSTSGLVDTYTITMNDGSTSTFTVTNARSISSISLLSGTHAPGTTDVYQISYNDSTTSTFSVYNGIDGSGNVSSVNNILPDSNGNVTIDAYAKPSGGIPSSDLSSGVRTSLGLADSALQEHQSLAAYRTSSSQDTIDAGKLAINQGVAHAGKFMIVGSDGNIVPTAMTEWSGGSY